MTPEGHVIVTLVGVVGSAAATSALTGVVRAYALREGLKDIPNDRSSHAQPTPRGGGLAIAAALFVASGGALVLDPWAWRWVLALVVGGGVNAAVGWMDDRRSLSVRFRLCSQFAVAAFALVLVGTRIHLNVLPGVVLPPLLLFPFVALYLTWMTNLYNFMDGVDGIAGAQATTVGLTLAIGAAAEGNAAVALISAAVAGSALGFLTHNWPPARIFMGDVGSALLGFVLGALGLWASSVGAFEFPAFLIAMSVFIVDATLTLVIRAIRREKVTQAHRSHAYQVLVRRTGSHRTVTVAVLAFNLGILTLAALWADLNPALAWVPLVVIWGALAAGFVAIGAGRPVPAGALK